MYLYNNTVPQGFARLLYLMQRTVPTSNETLQDFNHNWKKIQNDLQPDMFVLGREKKINLPPQWMGEIKAGLQTITNFRLRNIDISPVAWEFFRLYMNGTTFHSSKVIIIDNFLWHCVNA